MNFVAHHNAVETTLLQHEESQEKF